MTFKEHIRASTLLALPVMLSQVGHMLVSVSDSVMVGRIGSIPLAGISLANSIYSVILLFGIGVSYGLTPLVAAADGEGDDQMISSTLKNGMLLNLVIGLLMSAICALMVSILPYMGQSPEVVEQASKYLQVMSYSLLPLMVFQTLRQVIEGMSLTKEVMKISLSGNVVNVLLNYALIYGHLGFDAMGIVGAGVATVISRVLMAIALYVYYKRSQKFAGIHRKMVTSVFEFSLVKRILSVGLPTGLQYIMELGAFGASAIMIGWIGALPLAAHQIALNIAAITYMASTGFAAAGTIRVGNHMGTKDYKGLKLAGIATLSVTAIMMLISAVIFLLFRNQLPLIYVSEVDVVQLAGTLLIVAAFFQLSDGIQAVGLGVLRGLEDVKVPTAVTVFSYWGVAIPVGYILGIRLETGAIGVWIGLLVGLTIGAIAHYSRFYSLSIRLIKQTSA